MFASLGLISSHYIVTFSFKQRQSSPVQAEYTKLYFAQRMVCGITTLNYNALYPGSRNTWGNASSVLMLYTHIDKMCMKRTAIDFRELSLLYYCLTY